MRCDAKKISELSARTRFYSWISTQNQILEKKPCKHGPQHRARSGPPDTPHRTTTSLSCPHFLKTNGGNPARAHYFARNLPDLLPHVVKHSSTKSRAFAPPRTAARGRRRPRVAARCLWLIVARVPLQCAGAGFADGTLSRGELDAGITAGSTALRQKLYWTPVRGGAATSGADDGLLPGRPGPTGAHFASRQYFVAS